MKRVIYYFVAFFLKLPFRPGTLPGKPTSPSGKLPGFVVFVTLTALTTFPGRTGGENDEESATSSKERRGYAPLLAISTALQYSSLSCIYIYTVYAYRRHVDAISILGS